MEIEKQITKTYSKRQPVTRYESRAIYVPSCENLMHARESRRNNKTLVVVDFDDTFDRLATGVVVSSKENSLDGNGVTNENDSDIFNIFKMPMQAKKKPKQKRKPKKKDLVSKSDSVKRKKVNVNSDDSGSSDQEENHQKAGVSSDIKKSKDKVKRVVKRKRDLSPVKTVINHELFVSESVDENVSNNIESTNKDRTEAHDNFDKLKESSNVNQHKNSQNFKASTPTITRIHRNIDTQNISPVIMDKNNAIETENWSGVKHDASEYFNENPECNQNSVTNTADDFVKARESTKVHQLKSSNNLLTSTPRINKMHMSINLKHLSPIISEREKRAIGESNETSPIIDTNNVENEVESNVNDDIRLTSDQVAEPVKSPTKFHEIEHNDSENDCSKQNSVEGSEETSEKPTSLSRLKRQELIVSLDITTENNQDEKADENDSFESMTVDHSLVPIADVISNTKQTNENLAMNKDLHGYTRSFVQSPLLFDDTEYIETDKTIVVLQMDKQDLIEINFSQVPLEQIGENNKEPANLKNTHVEPASKKDKNFDVSTQSSFYPDEWTNDYDSTYGYDQLKKNHEKDATVDSTQSQGKQKESTICTEKTADISVENVTEINEVSNIDNIEIQPVANHKLTESTLCDEDNNAIKDNKNKSYAQEESYQDIDASCISNRNNHDSTNAEKENLQNSQDIMNEKQSSYEDEGESIILELDESMAKPDNQDSENESLTLSARPLKRRKTDTSEIMIFDKVDDDQVNIQSQEENCYRFDDNIGERIPGSKEVNGRNIATEISIDTSLVKPVCQYDEIVEKLQGKELRIILERVQSAENKLPILSRRKPLKRKSAKRVSTKSKDIDSEFIRKQTKVEETTKPDVARVIRSLTEDKMRQLYVQYQCKEVIIFTKRLNQKVVSPPKRSLKRKSRENTVSEDSDRNSSLTNGELSEFLAKLNDPVRVTTRRKTHKKYDTHLAAITEDQANQHSEDDVVKKIVTWGNDKQVTFNDFKEDSEDIEDSNRKSQPIFLKPGKSWARSLSIINHFHNGKNLDELAAGRENWRHSVQTVLNMQPEVAARTSSQNHEETRRESRASQVSSQRESKSTRKSSIATNSRSSMRIIPSGKRSTLTNDLMDSQRISYVSDRSRVSRKTSLKIRRDTLIETEDDLIKSAKDIILKRCKQTSYEPFDVCFPDSYIDNCRKIGEGVYGEVFLYEDGSEKSVIKIIPIEGDQLVNCEPQKKFHEILSEIIIAEELHKLRFDGEFHTNGFVEVNRIMCVIGKYPKKLIDFWYAYDEQKKSENDCPSMFEEDQLYIILELTHGGQDLEAYTFQNASESYTIFLQTALTLAVAEQSLEFEHRDLHWGNLLISKTEDKKSTYKLRSQEISLPTKGVKVAVIDFTLSRMSYQGCKIFNDLAADPTLFEAQGEYQFDIYRMMRDNVNDDWQQFNPFTNVLWLDYTLEKMITAVRYKRKTTKIHKSAIEDMKALRKEIMNYSSAFEFVTNCKKVQTLFDSS